jgi:hypothetical protein
MTADITSIMLDELKKLTYQLRNEHAWIFNACCDASRAGRGKIATARNAARARLIAWLQTDGAAWYAQEIGFVSVTAYRARIVELESELAKLKTCDTCESHATRHVCITHCHRT